MSQENELTAEEQITNYIAQHDDWRGMRLAELRKLVHAAAPELTETWKWGAAVFARKKNVLALSGFKTHVKINFFQGARLPDPNSLFNAGLDAKTMRSIDLREGDRIDEAALANLIRTASDYSVQKKQS